MEETYGIEREGKIARIKDSKGLYYVKNHPETLCNTEVLIIAPDKLLEGNFKNCEFVKEVWFENCIQELPNNCFESCKSLEYVNLLLGLKTIGDSAFSCCYSLKEIRIPATLKTLGESVFLNCTSLENVHLPPHLETLPYNTFRNCTALQFVKLPEKVAWIGENCFRKCYNLRSVSLPTGEFRIGFSSFEGCSNLKSINLSNCKGLGLRAFAKCKTLRDVVVLEEVFEYLEYFYPADYKADDNNVEYWVNPDFHYENYPFVGCKNLEKIEVYRKED